MPELFTTDIKVVIQLLEEALVRVDKIAVEWPEVARNSLVCGMRPNIMAALTNAKALDSGKPLTGGRAIVRRQLEDLVGSVPVHKLYDQQEFYDVLHAIRC